MPKPVPYDDLDPGIRELVRWLNDNDFQTQDSGDGRTKFQEDGSPLPEWTTADQDFECVMPFPHVVMPCPVEKLGSECDRLRDLLVGAGVPVEAQGPDGSPAIQGTYDPSLSEHPAYILLMGVDAALLAQRP
jgi:hypothetical protein